MPHLAPAGSKRGYWACNLISFLSLAAAALLAVFAREWVRTTLGSWVLAALGTVFVVTLLTLTSIATFGDDIEGNSFSELLHQSTLETTFYPWALAVYMGRWFHPVDGLESPLGIWGPVVLMAATWGVIVAGELRQRRGTPIPPWAIVAAGFACGAVAWPA